MENVLPVIFLILYLVIQSVSKRRKAESRERVKPSGGDSPSTGKPAGGLQSLLEALGVEAEEMQRGKAEPIQEPQVPFWQTAEPVESELPPAEPTPEIEMEPPPDIWDYAEGIADEQSYERPTDEPYARKTKIPYERSVETPYKRSDREVHLRPERKVKRSRLGGLLDDMPVLKKGIVLQTILGPPRSLQKGSDWFYRPD